MSPASLLALDEAWDDVRVSELDSDVEDPRRRWANLNSFRARLWAVFFKLAVMSQMAQQARSGKMKTRT